MKDNNYKTVKRLVVYFLLFINTLPHSIQAQITVNSTNVSGCDKSDGKASIIVNTLATGLNFEYSVDNVPYQAANLFENLKVGTHTALVRDKNSQCEFSKPFNIAFTLTCPPITIKLTAQCEDSHTILKWATNNLCKSYSIEASKEGMHWSVISYIDSVAYNQSDLLSLDVNLRLTSNFYRVVATQENGIKNYSAITGSPCAFEQSVSVWPNPANNIVNIQIPSLKANTIYLTLSNSQGLVVFSQQSNLHIGRNQFQIDLSKFSAGIYTLTTQSDNLHKTSKIKKN